METVNENEIKKASISDSERFNNPKVGQETFGNRIVGFWIYFMQLQLAFYSFLFFQSSTDQQGNIFLGLMYFNLAIILFLDAIADFENVFKLVTLRGVAILIITTMIYWLLLAVLNSAFIRIFSVSEFFTYSLIIQLFFLYLGAEATITFIYIFVLNGWKDTRLQIYEVDFNSSFETRLLFRWLFIKSVLLLFIYGNAIILITVYFKDIGFVTSIDETAIFLVFIFLLIFVEIAQTGILFFELYKGAGMSGPLVPKLNKKVKIHLFYLLMSIQLLGILWGMITINWLFGVMALVAFVNLYFVLIYFINKSRSLNNSEVSSHSVYFYSLLKQI